MYIELTKRQIRELTPQLSTVARRSALRHFLLWLAKSPDVLIVERDPNSGNWVPILNPAHLLDEYEKKGK